MYLNELEVRLYLTRIGVEYSFSRCDLPNLERLSQLHQSHLSTVPFENLSIALNQEMLLGGYHAFEKIVAEHRGGFCYELNYAFYQLLCSLKFDVSILSAQVFNQTTNDYGQPFDHLVLRVNLADKSYLVDVGFGDSFILPINLNGKTSYQINGDYKITDINGMKVLHQRKSAENWLPQYKFSLEQHTIEDFAGMFEYHQFNPQSTFTQKTVCTLLRDYGRITVANGSLIRTEHGEKQEIVIGSIEKLQQLLLNEFNINVLNQADIKVLMPNSV